MESLMSRITGGRYSRIWIDEELNLTVGRNEPDPGEPDGLEPSQLSQGAVDQLYFAARLSLLDFIAGPGRSPFILDDVLVNFDHARRQATLGLLREIARDRQVILLTCDRSTGDWADRVIDLPELAKRSAGVDVGSSGGSPGTSLACRNSGRR
jgi:uncharacterized protein YhaN